MTIVRISISVEASFAGTSTTLEEEVDVSRCATEADVEESLEEAARNIFFNHCGHYCGHCSYGWVRVEDQSPTKKKPA